MLHRALQRVVVPLPTALDPALGAVVAGLLVIGALAAVDGMASRDGFAVIQRFALPAAALVVWTALFQTLRPTTVLVESGRPSWPAAGGLLLSAGAAIFIASQSSGQPWGVVAIAAASYLSLFGAAVLRRQPGGWGVALVVVVQLAMAATAFLLLPAPWSVPAAALLSVVALAFLIVLRWVILPRRFAPLDELAGHLAALRGLLPALIGAAAASIVLSLMIGGQTAALGRLLVPVAGLAATRLVAEEVFLRLWLLPSLERRLGAALALVLTAGCSAAVAAAVRPAGWSPAAAAAAAAAAALAAGLLARRTRNGPAVVVFRLLVG
ncbi:MAG: hypothetical protein KatS3mg060_1228 [Dehalococcoidia bacterium]|nr:MAG: hypothetical protein KatS3mg060_1228 [Dehalococcoidia bacterium]